MNWMMTPDRAAEMASCDAARAAWFRGAGGDPGPTPEQLAWIRADREATRQSEGGGGCADQVADTVEASFGWPAFRGVYLTAAGEPITQHAWNVLPDGALLDAAADRFGEGHDVRIIRPEDPAYRRYRAEWTPEYHPGLATHWPELAGCQWSGETDRARAAQHDHAFDVEADTPWWLAADRRAAWQAYRDRQAEHAALCAPGPGAGR